MPAGERRARRNIVGLARQNNAGIRQNQPIPTNTGENADHSQTVITGTSGIWQLPNPVANWQSTGRPADSVSPATVRMADIFWLAPATGVQ